MRYAWIAAQREVYTVDEMCRVLAVSESGYRAWTRGGTPDRTRLTDAQLLALIRAIHAALKGAYGSPRMVRELRGRGVPASKERVERLMREHGIRGRHKRRVHRHDGLDAPPAGGRERTESGLHAIRPESDVDLGHHLSVDG